MDFARRWLSGLALLAAYGCASAGPLATNTVGEQRYKSRLGFTAVVPLGWALLTRETLKSQPGLLSQAFRDPNGVDPATGKTIRAELENGEVDFLVRIESGPGFVDFINIIARPTTDVWSREDVETILCPYLMKLMLKTGARGIVSCDYQDVNGTPGLITQKLGDTPDTSVIQYMVLAAPVERITVTAIAKNSRAKSVAAIVAQFVNSIRIEQ